MRDIKFRAWGIKGKGFIAGFNMVNFHGYFNKGLKPNIYRYETEWEEGEYILEQFTGLLDKNGKEIYEGDVVRVMVAEITDKNPIPSIPAEAGAKFHTGNKVKAIWTVEIVDHLTYTGPIFYGINRRFNLPASRSSICNNQAEVIGNIHQSPELLK